MEEVSLFEEQIQRHVPLPERMRPQTLEAMVGQAHLLSQTSAFQNWLKNNGRGNVLLYGPPGCGKTTLAQLIAKHLQKELIPLNAVLANLNELREKLKLAERNSEKTILFIDEIHRFNRSQQDVLLPYCETGRVQLIGATTHNPAFYIIPPLLSRSYVFELKKVEPSDIVFILKNTLENKQHGLGNLKLNVPEVVLGEIARIANGDLRRALHLLEFLCTSVPIGSTLELEHIKTELSRWHASYNARENDHYDLISAFIKSMRGCDPDAAVYWLARMIEGGEDPLFIARRLVIFASEDVGLADSRGLNLALAAYNACEKIGLPECAINLSHATVFLALAPKSNSAYLAWNAARDFVKSGHLQSVPNALQQTPLHREQTYKYSHDYEANISGQSYWDEACQFYHPKAVGAEKALTDLYNYRQQLKTRLHEKNNPR